ncbi:MAG: HDOD domain-containing protein [Steroidobacteraceae bacterium]|jgi:HD-like signal output (HDOD) protein|nr:HDOD domain-containing protein [Steroidobacteraceae bacterium]
MTAAQQFSTPDHSWQMSLVQMLAADVSGGRLELPSFPDVVIRIRQALSDENVSVEKVARLVGTEPALAARLLKLANSTALNPGGRAVTDLKAAITRMGHNLVRTSALSFAMGQIQRASEYRGIAGQLRQLWESATRVSAVTHAVAKRMPRCHPEEAMLSGLLHTVGKTYILTRFAGSQPLAGREEELSGIMAGWHASVGKAVLENWGLPEQIVSAVERQDEFDHADRPDASDLAHVLATGRLLADYVDGTAGLETVAAQSRWLARLALDAGTCASLLEDSRAEILDLRRALDG